MKSIRDLSTDLIIVGVLIVITGLIVGIPVVDFLTSQRLLNISFPLTTEAYSALINSLGSLVLTLGLVLVYAQLVRTQERQEEWMEADHTPDVSVDWWNPKVNMLKVDLTNPGNGAAKNIRLNIEIDAVHGAVPDTHLFLEGGAELYRDDITSRVIPAKETKTVRFETRDPVKLSLKTFPSHRPSGMGDGNEKYSANFDEIIDILCRDGIDIVDYSLSIDYDYIKREGGSVRFYAGSVDIAQGMHFEDIVANTHEDEEIEMFVPPKISKQV